MVKTNYSLILILMFSFVCLLVFLVPVSFSLELNRSNDFNFKITPDVLEQFSSDSEENYNVLASVFLESTLPDKSFSKRYFNNIIQAVKDGEIIESYYPRGFVAELSKADMERVARFEGVKSIEGTPTVRTALEDVTKIINVEKVWDTKLYGWKESYTGEGTVACVIDTGVDFSHPDLLNANALGNGLQYDCYSGECVLTQNVQDLNGHGTRVAGVLVANGQLKGVAPNAKIISLKVFSGASGQFESLIPLVEAIDKCTKIAEQQGITVISISLATDILFTNHCDSFSPTLSFYVTEAEKKGIAVVAATGNNANSGAIALPSCFSKAIPVGATTKQDEIASFSNLNGLVGLLAPGQDVLSTKSGGGYALGSGTSVSVPEVSGAILIINQIMMGVNGNLIATPLEVENTLYEYGFEILSFGSGESGGLDFESYSRIDVGESIKEYDSNVKIGSSATSV